MKKKTEKEYLSYFITLFIILASFILLEPKFLSKIFLVRNEKILNNFIDKTISSNMVDSQEFWKMREFYCPGSFTFDKSKNPFLVYTCSWLKSEDSFTSAKKFIEAKKSFNIKKEKNLIYISFILPISEMRKANGYFDYSGKDKKFLEGKNWLNKTVVTLENK